MVVLMIIIYRFLVFFVFVFAQAHAAIVDRGFNDFKNKLIVRFGQEIIDEALNHQGMIDLALITGARSLTIQDATFIIDQIEQTFAEELAHRFEQQFFEQIDFIPPIPQQRLRYAAQIATSLKSPNERCQLYFQLYKTVIYFKEISSFSKGNYLEQQSTLLELSAKLT